MLPGLDGLAIIDELRQRRIKLPVIILSAKRSIDERVEGLEAGGDDLPHQAFLLLRAAGAHPGLDSPGERYTRAHQDHGWGTSIDLRTRAVTRADKKIPLQPREFLLLEYLVRNAGRVVSKTMIMEHVWDYNFDPQTNVVVSRICRLRDKIDKGFDTPLIHTVRGMGYVLKDTA